MPFDPALPPNAANIRADVLRAQFNGLKALIDAVPAGPPGPAGPQGPSGADGAPGEVTTAALIAAIATTSATSNAVAMLDTPFSDPPTLADLEALRAKLNELITALRR